MRFRLLSGFRSLFLLLFALAIFMWMFILIRGILHIKIVASWLLEYPLTFVKCWPSMVGMRLIESFIINSLSLV